MIPDRGMVAPMRFMGRFLLAASLLLLAWACVSDLYAATLVLPANWIFDAQGMPVTLALRDNALALGLSGAAGHMRYFQLQGHDLAYLHLPAAMALLLAAPGWGLRSRLVWCAAAAFALWLTHVVGLFAGGYSAVGDYLAALPPETRSELLGTYGGRFSASLADSLGYLVGWWSAWGGPALSLVFFALAAPLSQLWGHSDVERA